jgi:hypothetical protein
MRRKRGTRYLLWLMAAALASGGCRCWHSYRPVTILVRDAETREPIPDAKVRLGYYLLLAPFAPKRTAGTTGPDGTVELVAAPYEGRAVLFASADGYFSEGMLRLDDDVIRACDPGRHNHHIPVVVEMFAEPAATVELVVPAGYRGLVRVEVQEIPPPTVRLRTVCVPVPASGMTLIKGPRLLRRAECVDFSVRCADGTLLESPPPDPAAVGFWRLDADDDVRFFLVGTQKDHDDWFGRLHRATADGGWEFDRAAAEACLASGINQTTHPSDRMVGPPR